MIIYIIKNDINSRVYIGQTTKDNLEERIRMYEDEYLFVKEERPIISAMRKYGWEHFYFEILEEDIATKEELDEKERRYIKEYSSLCSENGYNVELGGNGPGKHAEETKKKIGDAQRGPKNHMYGKMNELNHWSKSIIDLTTGEKFGSAMEVSRKYGLNFPHVCGVARGERGSHKGHVFRYLDSDGNIIQDDGFAAIKSFKDRDAILPQYKYLFPYFLN